MSYRCRIALALGMAAVLATGGQTGYGQRVSEKAYRRPLTRSAATAPRRMSQAAFAEEELPDAGAPSRIVPSQPIPPDGLPTNPFDDDSGLGQGPTAECYHDGCSDGYCADAGCDPGCCDSCGNGCSTGQCFVTADYLYARASFSDSVGFAAENQQGTETERNLAQLEFDYESSFRFGGGYRWGGCGDEIRFLYTRLESAALLQQDGGDGIFVPYYGDLDEGEQLVVHGDVEVNAYDLEYSKTIPLGGGSGGCGCGDACGGGCGCGSACGCGDCCGSCPAWDVRWSGGFRAADAEWNREYVFLGEADEIDGTALSSMDFDGAGLKVGLEGRRYFFSSGWLSIYAKGDLSLLYGDLEFTTVRTIEGGTAPDQIARQSTTTNQIIPVTELEAGLSGQISCHARISAGYLLSAWHDLGFRDEVSVDGNSPLQIAHDDANILGFDGFFARLEYGF